MFTHGHVDSSCKRPPRRVIDNPQVFTSAQGGPSEPTRRNTSGKPLPLTRSVSIAGKSNARAKESPLKNNSEISRTIASYRKFADFRELGLGQGVVNPVNKSALDSLSFPRKHVSERYSSATTQNDIQAGTNRRSIPACSRCAGRSRNDVRMAQLLLLVVRWIWVDAGRHIFPGLMTQRCASLCNRGYFNFSVGREFIRTNMLEAISSKIS